MKIARADRSMIDGWLRLRLALWPECKTAESRKEIEDIVRADHLAAFIATDDTGNMVGFIEVSLRNYVDGATTSPFGFIEGLYVAPDHRHRGSARALVRAGEAWALSKGCSEMGSDTQIDNESSIAFHKAAGYREVERQVVFLRTLA